MSLVYNYLYIDLPESVQVCYQTDTELNNIWLPDISTQTVWYQIDIELTNIWLPKVKNKGLTSQQCFKIGCWYIDIFVDIFDWFERDITISFCANKITKKMIYNWLILYGEFWSKSEQNMNVYLASIFACL